MTRPRISDEPDGATRVTSFDEKSPVGRGHTWYKTTGYYLLSVSLGLGIWAASVAIFDIPDYLLPGPTAVFAEIIEHSLSRVALMKHAWVTAYETILGFGAAIAVAVPLAVLMVYSRIAAALLYPGLVISQVVPKIALAPIFIVWMGFGLMPKVVIAFLIAFFVVVVDTTVGLKSVDPNMIYLARSMGATELGVFTKVRLPNALPNFFGGLKVAITLALVGAVVGELVGSNEGLGYIVLIALGQFNMTLMFASVVLMGFVGIALFGVVQVIERLAIPWSASARLDEMMTSGTA